MADSQELSSSSWSPEGLVMSKEGRASGGSAAAGTWAPAFALRPVIRRQRTLRTPIQRMAALRKGQYRHLILDLIRYYVKRLSHFSPAGGSSTAERSLLTPPPAADRYRLP